MNEPEDELQAVAGDLAGDALRSVGSYDENERELQYLREDVAESYSEDEIDEVIDEFVLPGIGRGYLEGIFHAGRLDWAMLGFEEAAITS